MLSIEVIESDARFARLSGEWPALLAASAADCPFLTWEWLSAWWRHLSTNRRLHVLALREGGDLIGVAPFALRPPEITRLLPFRVLEFLGTGYVGSDYLDLIVAHGSKARVIDEVADYLDSRSMALDLSRIRSNSLSMDLLGVLEGSNRWLSRRGASEVCPYVKLGSKSWDAYLGSLGASHRYNVRRRLRNLSRRFTMRFVQAQTEAECADWLEVLIRLHTQRRESGLERSTAFHQTALVRFHRQFTILALRRGWLRLQLLLLDEAPAAALYGLKYGGTFYFYQSGFDPGFSRYSIGLATLALAIRGAIAEGADEFDMLHGDESYKFLWARDVHALARHTAFPPGLRGSVCHSLLGLREHLKRLPGAASSRPAAALAPPAAEADAQGLD
jgi:CelD/BcsL family acetyltransferase involved in cellulose biosynthesis